MREICIQFNLPVERELLEALFDYCDVDNDGQIDYTEFSNFLNWKDKLPVTIRTQEGVGEVRDPEVLHKQIDRAAVDFKTSSQMINATVGGVATRGIPY